MWLALWLKIITSLKNRMDIRGKRDTLSARQAGTVTELVVRWLDPVWLYPSFNFRFRLLGIELMQSTNKRRR